MAVGAQLSFPDRRFAARHSVNWPVIAEHRQLGDLTIQITNVSANGIMVQGSTPLSRGERIIVKLPVVGRIEALKIWEANDKSGFQLERVIRADDFMAMVKAMQLPRQRPVPRIVN